jgi:preprotein translocase subunit SecE
VLKRFEVPGFEFRIYKTERQTSNSKNMNKITTYFRESYKELIEKVTWPTWAQLQQSTMIVLAATLVITALVWVMDFATGNVLKQVYKFFF